MRQSLDPKLYNSSLIDALIDARAKYGDKEILEDQDRNPLTYTGLIRAAFVLGRKIAGMTDKGERVAILLPSSMGTVVTFFGLHAHGRVPVMLNFTAGEANVKAAIKASGVKKVLTAKRFIEQAALDKLIEAIGTVADVVWLDDVRKTIGFQDKLYGLSAGLAPKRFAVKTQPDDPGVVLFTSGSFGVPKGVVLSQKNLIANARQVGTHIALDPSWVMFNPLPTFHCFGLTAGAILPLLEGLKGFQYPSPLHAKQITDLLPQVGATLLFATDTFLNQYARVAEPGDFATVKFAVGGAEKVRDETRALFEAKFGNVELLEGYGASEAAPVIAVNKPGENHPGTVGQLLPGIDYRLEPVEGVDAGGRLVIKGPNVMSGYVTNGEPLQWEPVENGWLDTGDIVDVDAEGFVTIRGRAKRFAKIGGEMVSLTAVEGMAGAVWPDNRHAVVAIPDNRKGEKLVLITERDGAETSELSAWAKANGAPELVVPKKIIKVDEIPVLGSGKTDYVSLQKLAEAA
ncbi:MULTISPECIES: AMP-binding protein [Brevundimonas]|uniref:AMP-binding protein n=1 Tax=Brevundimonas pishanensis TaxID=2896315 RepID=UPI001FA79104|nr:AMP-binding protein [Brevundimonas pishanensis]